MCFQYENESEAGAEEQEEADLTEDMLVGLPDIRIREVHQMARIADHEPLLKSLEQIDDSHPEVARIFTRWIRDFRYDSLSELLKSLL